MAFSSNSSAQTSDINVTPLIDVLLVLLIMFMVVLPGASYGLESPIPQGKSDQAKVLPPVLIKLLAGPSGTRYELAGSSLPQEDVPVALRGLFKVRSDRTLVVQADRSLTYQEVAAVISEAREAGAGSVILSALPR